MPSAPVIGPSPPRRSAMRTLLPAVALFFLTVFSVSAADPPLPTLPFDAERAGLLREDWAKSLGLQQEFTNTAGMKLVLIPGGRFEMGPNGSKHRVTLARAYYLGVTEVTLGEYCKFKPGHRIVGAADEFNTDDRPAAMVSWNDARDFCTWL